MRVFICFIYLLLFGFVRSYLCGKKECDKCYKAEEIIPHWNGNNVQIMMIMILLVESNSSLFSL